MGERFQDRAPSRSTGFLRGGGSLRTSLLIGITCFFVYNANLRTISAGDTYPARYQPFGILRHGSLSLDPILSLVRHGRTPAQTYWIQPGRGGSAISLYPVVLPVLTSPLYVPAALYLQNRGWPEQSLERVARIMEKLTASLLAAASAALLFLLLRRRASPRLSLVLTLVYAFGTTTWVISSQALWQHGLAQLLVVSALLLVTGPATPTRVIAAGLMLGLIAGNRPPDALLAAALGVPGLFWARRRAPWLVAAAAIPAGLILAYNFVWAGHWAGGYGVAGRAEFFPNDLLHGLAGMLVSPTHGLFVFSPFLLALPLALRRVWEDVDNRRLTLALGIGMGLQLLLYSKADWTGGASWGPRWLTDLLPILFWMLPPVVVSLRRMGRILFACGCGAAIVIEAIGAFWYMHASDDAVLAASDPKQARWDFRNAPFLLELRHPPAPRDLWRPEYQCDATDVRGSVDLLAGRAVAGDIPVREDLRAAGWTLVGGRTPWEVAITLDDRTVASTSRFFTRSDVVRALGLTDPSGWVIRIPAADLAPGEHVLAVVARSCPASPPQLVLKRRVVTSDAGCDATDVRGSLDVLGGHAGREVPAHQDLRAAGWTLIGDRSPWEVVITLDDRTVASTSRFFARSDVASELRLTSPSGWRIQIPAADLTPGEHVLGVVARSCPSGQPLLLLKRRIVASDTLGAAARASAGRTGSPGPRRVDLPASARRATALLAQHQKPGGHWLTSHTAAPRFEGPVEEMNTFLTSTLVDLLDPVAADAGLRETVRRARSHLTAQIEAGGLVRYHGLPDGPTIGGLGCVITPDADDTALVWRIAPGPNPERLRTALATLGRYRTTEGLYRTWLSPRDRYQCIDPGRDPNPADVAIQMHVLMLLARADPPAARALCSALTRVIDKDHVWVYYRMAPPVPILRQADLEDAGCALALPDSRVRTSVPGQEDWVAAATLLRRFAGRNQTAPASEETLALLRTLAADDFAAIRSNPPLLYHNDPTASVRRFYWSEDFGYALWLRLFFAHDRRFPASVTSARPT
jgi:hypothetical protein